MAATLTRDRFTSEDWSFERKHDGIRLLAYKPGGNVRLLSRADPASSAPADAAAQEFDRDTSGFRRLHDDHALGALRIDAIARVTLVVAKEQRAADCLGARRKGEEKTGRFDFDVRF